MTEVERLRIEASMLRDALAEERRRRRLLQVQVADLVAALRRHQERASLERMEAKASRLFEAAQTQPL